jgi:hypothetical protein
MKIPTKAELEKRRGALIHEFNLSDTGGKERVMRSIRLVDTALLQLKSHEAEQARRKSEADKEARKEEAQKLVIEATRHGLGIAEHIAALCVAAVSYKAALANALQACPSLKNGANDNLLNERELLKSIAAEIHHAGLKLPQGGSSATGHKSMADRVRQTEWALLGIIDGFSSLYQCADEMGSE